MQRRLRNVGPNKMLNQAKFPTSITIIIGTYRPLIERCHEFSLTAQQRRYFRQSDSQGVHCIRTRHSLKSRQISLQRRLQSDCYCCQTECLAEWMPDGSPGRPVRRINVFIYSADDAPEWLQMDGVFKRTAMTVINNVALIALGTEHVLGKRTRLYKL